MDNGIYVYYYNIIIIYSFVYMTGFEWTCAVTGDLPELIYVMYIVSGYRVQYA